LDRQGGDISKAASSLLCLEDTFEEYIRTPPVRRFKGALVVSLDPRDLGETIESADHQISLALISAARSILNGIPAKRKKTKRALVEQAAEGKVELVRPPARLLCIRDDELRRELAKK
jgi:hypothetical protein